jgi:hypothetical protein
MPQHKMKKYSFSRAERYAIWLNHEKRCWLCREPLRLIETTIDHVLPEKLLEDAAEFRSVVEAYALPEEFNINGFENWLPCHNHCNQSKSSATFEFVPGNKLILDRLIRDAPKVERTANSIKENVTKDKLFANVFVALEKKEISLDNLQALVNDLGGWSSIQNERAMDTAKMIRLDNGYWLHEDDVRAEGLCTCERGACVDSGKKVHCYWADSLSEWVVRKRLYWKCYDEIVSCPRCHGSHKRGHIGKQGVCGKLYKDQLAQRD